MYDNLFSHRSLDDIIQKAGPKNGPQRLLRLLFDILTSLNVYLFALLSVLYFIKRFFLNVIYLISKINKL